MIGLLRFLFGHNNPAERHRAEYDDYSNKIRDQSHRLSNEAMKVRAVTTRADRTIELASDALKIAKGSSGDAQT